jgi:hypothetical protein
MTVLASLRECTADSQPQGRDEKMTGIESRSLKVSDRVCWNSDSNDHGTVIEADWAGVTIKWVKRSEQTILHNDMAQVKRAR